LIKQSGWKPGGFDALGYTVHPTTAGILCRYRLRLDEHSSNPYDRYFVFNSQNGEIIYRRIFHTAGFKGTEEEVKGKRGVLIAAHLKKIKASPMMALIWKHQNDLASCNEKAELDMFYVTATGVIFHKYDCLPYVIQGQNPNLDITYSFGQLQARLSASGRNCSILRRYQQGYISSLSKPMRARLTTNTTS